MHYAASAGYNGPRRPTAARLCLLPDAAAEVRIGVSEQRQTLDRPEKPWWYVAPPPWWIWLLALLAALGSGAWHLISASGDRGAGLFLAGTLWPGVAIAGAVLAVCWLGWALDLE